MPGLLQGPAPVPSRYSGSALTGALLSLRACTGVLSSVCSVVFLKRRAELPSPSVGRLPFGLALCCLREQQTRH